MSAVLASIRNIPNNPVLRRELDVRARSKATAVAMSAWLLLLGGLAALVYFGYTTSADGITGADNAEIGQEIFHWTLVGMMTLVLFLVPAFTANSVAGERTRQTLIPVQMTGLGPFDIVLGKALASIAFTVLLIIAAGPMLAVAFLVGGVTLGDLASAVGILVLTAVMVGSVGIMISSRLKSVQASTVASYFFVASITIGSGIVLAVVAILLNLDNQFGPGEVPPVGILAVNPYAGLADAVASPAQDFFFDGPQNPITALRQGIFELHREGGLDAVRREGNIEVSALWRWYVLFCLATTYVSMYAATNRLRTPAVTER